MFTFAGKDSWAGLGFLCVKEKVDGHGGNACLVRKGTSELRSPSDPSVAPLDTAHLTLAF